MGTHPYVFVSSAKIWHILAPIGLWQPFVVVCGSVVLVRWWVGGGPFPELRCFPLLAFHQQSFFACPQMLCRHGSVEQSVQSVLELALLFLVFVFVLLIFVAFACLAFCFLLLPRIGKSMETTPRAAVPACARESSNSIVLICEKLFRM